jgi:hypothetical protein
MIGIPIIDKVLKILPWDKSKELKKVEKIYGIEGKEQFLELLLIPFVGLESINDLAESTGQNKDKYYKMLRNEKINWKALLQEITLHLFLVLLEKYQKSKSESTKSRWRPRIIFDDTLIRHWSLSMANVFNRWNYVDKHYMYAQKLVFMVVVIGDNKLSFPLMFDFISSKKCEDYKSNVEISLDMLRSLHNIVKSHHLCLDGVRITCDSGFTNHEIFNLSVELGLQFYGSLQSKWIFTLSDGTSISVRDLKNGSIPTRARVSPKMKREYYRLLASHPKLGNIVLCIVPYYQPGKTEPLYWVYCCSYVDIDCVTIYKEHQIRWAIERMFKNLKQYLGIFSYQGLSSSAHDAWLTLTALRFLFFQVTLKVAARFPSLRSNIPLSKFGFAALFRYIRDHFVLDSKLRKIKRLHYSIVKELPDSFVLVSI